MIKPSPTAYGLRMAQPRMQKFKKSAVYIIRKIKDGFEAGIAEESVASTCWERHYPNQKKRQTPIEKETCQTFKTYEEAEKHLQRLREAGL